MEDALKILYSHYTPKPLGIEEVPLERALNRVLAEDVYSDVDVPPFDRATVDGFAVIASDTFHAHENRPVTLRYGGTVDAGKVPKIKVVPRVAVEIGTGAVIPKGANAVVMVEHTSREGDFVKIYRSVAPGHNIQFAGSDVMKGEFVLRKNTILTPHEIGVLAAVGIAKVKVYRKPKVALISTGDEIAEPGETLEYGKIYDINRFTITSHLIEDGAEPTFIGVARDNPDEISSLIKKGLEVADVVISSGSTSAGVRDILYNLINKLGKPGILVHGIKTKPGKPTIIALLNGKPFFGLPGYPTSALMIYKSIVSPIIRKLSGYPTIKRRKSVKAIIKSPIYAETGRTNLVPVSLIYDSKGQLIAFPTPGGSGSIMKLANADGYIKIPETINFLEENSEVEVFLFSEDFEPPDLFIIGSHCLGLDLILLLMIRRNPDLRFRVINTGSYGGLMSVLRDEADLRYIGMDYGWYDGYYGDMFVAAFNTYGSWHTPQPYFAEFDLYVDSDEDGYTDVIDFNWNYGAATGGDDNDIWVVMQLDLSDYALYMASPYLIYTDYNAGFQEWYLPTVWNSTDPTNTDFEFMAVNYDYDGNNGLGGIWYWDTAYSPISASWDFEIAPDGVGNLSFSYVNPMHGNDPVGLMLVDYQGKPGTGQAYLLPEYKYYFPIFFKGYVP